MGRGDVEKCRERRKYNGGEVGIWGIVMVARELEPWRKKQMKFIKHSSVF